MSSAETLRGAPATRDTARALWPMALANTVVCVALALQHARFDLAQPWPANLFLLLVCLTYPGLYVLVAALPLLLGAGLTRGLRPHPREAVLTALAVPCFAAAPVLLFADLRVQGVIGFHLNGFVWNLIITPGGINSLGASDAALALVAVLVVGALGLEFALLWILRRWIVSRDSRFAFLRRRRAVVGIALAWLLASAGERALYAGSDLRDYAPVLRHADALPLYLPLTVKRLAARLGVEVVPRAEFRISRAASALRYPQTPLRGQPGASPPNVVWLCAESLRADAITPDTTPAIWRLARESVWFRNHLSTGNGTRMGLFGMFYGLPGSYWFSFLRENRGPVLIDWLIDADYRIEAFTADDFSYPELGQTLFVRVPAKHLHAVPPGPPSWRRDRLMVEGIRGFLNHRDPGRPFFLFAFFESPHARYEFPEESAIRTPYLDRMNYVTMNLERDIELIRNRYLNSVHHFDSQVERVLDALEERGLADNSIVIVTGDHGEEFLEKGNWGHGSTFSEEQIRVPLIIRAPGLAPGRVERMTSHLDLPATQLARLGVTSDAQGYSEGFDLFGGEARRFAVVADWNSIGLVDEHVKLRLPMSAFGMTRTQVSTRDDAPVADESAVLRERSAALGELLHAVGRFRARGRPAG